MKIIALLIPLVSLGWVTPKPWVGKDLNAVVQDRFGHVTEKDIREGRLGVKRVIEPESTHLTRRFKAKTPTESRALEGLEAEGWTASMYVLGREGALTGPILTGGAALPEAPDALKIRTLGQGVIKGGKSLQDAWGPYTVEARTIPVSGPSCAGCHDPSLKEGDPLGAVVYLFHRTVAP